MDINVLVVDDEKEICELIEIYLEKEGYNVFKAYDGLEAVNIIRKEDVNLALIDIMIPEINGYKVVKKIRDGGKIPIIMISAKSEPQDKILGLDLGADDYITKPFNPLELVARVNAQLRRFYEFNEVKTEQSVEKIIKHKELTLDTGRCLLLKGEKEINLTSKEFKIMAMLMRRIGQIFTKKQIYEEVWEEQYFGEDNVIMVHMSKLRDKIEDIPKEPKYLKTVRGLGYKVMD
ncbi:response regulator transcription factor [Oceanirhabdus seepicola]|uniref:Stage 0 sporulation protein A homolog n=1 Tax=Oceanirhabdus seepicola TaxID=2828781 RepID=A0A9J6P132_9CLOT|nr:response regulator transcription factor [Oceanirhabdus seepicola]MCM1989926.1 response regulator transcription factor [Oceanirhabdus seepicola]